MSSFSHTSFGQILKWVAAERGWRLPDDRAKVVAEANKVRRWMYSAYTRLKIATDVEECITATEFCMPCHDCLTNYVGISLPEEIISAAGIWINGAPVQANSRWREYQDGIRRVCGKRLEATYTGIPSPTELDICPCGIPVQLGLQAIEKADEGKQATIQYHDQNKNLRTDTIVLRHGEYVQTQSPVMAIVAPGGVTLPEDLCGGVIMAQMDSSYRIISEYKPWQHKPSFRRLSLPGVCAGQQVLVRGNRRYHDLYFNHETAEIDNELAIVAITRYLKYSSSASPGEGYQELSKFHEAEAMKYISGDGNREIGAATVNRFTHSHGARRRSRLSGR